MECVAMFVYVMCSGCLLKECVGIFVNGMCWDFC